jgi:hypothetical protein
MEDVGYFYGRFVYFTPKWYVAGIFCGRLVHFVAIWFTFSRFSMLHREKSGNPVALTALPTSPCFFTHSS